MHKFAFFSSQFRLGLTLSVLLLILTIVVQSFIFAIPAARAETTIPVTTNVDSGAGSLLAAITNANNTAVVERITFSLSAGNRKISLTSPLPAITKQATIGGTSQTDYVASIPLIELDGSGDQIGMKSGFTTLIEGAQRIPVINGGWLKLFDNNRIRS